MMEVQMISRSIMNKIGKKPSPIMNKSFDGTRFCIQSVDDKPEKTLMKSLHSIYDSLF
jgi:hypothetical protein